jgi:hypothetical protein
MVLFASYENFISAFNIAEDAGEFWNDNAWENRNIVQDQRSRTKFLTQPYLLVLQRNDDSGGLTFEEADESVNRLREYFDSRKLDYIFPASVRERASSINSFVAVINNKRHIFEDFGYFEAVNDSQTRVIVLETDKRFNLDILTDMISGTYEVLLENSVKEELNLISELYPSKDFYICHLRGIYTKRYEILSNASLGDFCDGVTDWFPIRLAVDEDIANYLKRNEIINIDYTIDYTVPLGQNELFLKALFRCLNLDENTMLKLFEIVNRNTKWETITELISNLLDKDLQEANRIDLVTNEVLDPTPQNVVIWEIKANNIFELADDLFQERFPITFTIPYYMEFEQLIPVLNTWIRSGKRDFTLILDIPPADENGILAFLSGWGRESLIFTVMDDRIIINLR